jgi:CxxC-x17-CxxC domain-containing protein
MPDEVLTCVVCGAEFIHSEDEQVFFEKLGFKNKPKRCSKCRPRRDSKPDRVVQNGRITVRTTCDQCGNSTTVPFEPSLGRRVLCKPCYTEENAA